MAMGTKATAMVVVAVAGALTVMSDGGVGESNSNGGGSRGSDSQQQR